MNDCTSGRRRRPGPRRACGLAAAVTGIALVAACGGGRSSTVAGATTYQKALTYTHCMRTHGVPDFPDPTSQGTFSTHITLSPQVQSAQSHCADLLPSRGQMVAADRHQGLSKFLKFSACMRSHGIPNFPDPVVHGSGLEISVPPGVDSNSPPFQSAQQACRTFLPNHGKR